MKESIVKDKSYAFALKIVRLARFLRKSNEYELASQIVRAGTSIGANVEEALAGTSRADFVAKMCIASREARESHYWLRLLRDAGILTAPESHALIGEADALVRMLTAIVKTSRIKTKPQSSSSHVRQ